MKFIKKLYDWVLHWAETPYGIPALFILAFAESSFFPVPPDVLLIALAISIPAKSFRFAAVCMVGSVIGGIVGYGIGLYGYESIGKPIVDFYHGQEIMNSIKAQYDQHDFLGDRQYHRGDEENPEHRQIPVFGDVLTHLLDRNHSQDSRKVAFLPAPI